jgi:hypothetical protein
MLSLTLQVTSVEPDVEAVVEVEIEPVLEVRHWNQ